MHTPYNDPKDPSPAEGWAVWAGPVTCCSQERMTEVIACPPVIVDWRVREPLADLDPNMLQRGRWEAGATGWKQGGMRGQGQEMSDKSFS